MPGWTAGNGTCFVQCYGLQAVGTNFKLLDMKQATSWVPISSKYMARAVVGGFENYGTSGLVDTFVCRARWQGKWVGGKAFFPANDRSYCAPALAEDKIFRYYDILVYSDNSPSTANTPPATLCTPPSDSSPCGACAG